MSSWLAREQSSLDKERLKSLGNIVMPHVGFFALNVIARQQLGTLPR